MGKSVAIIVVGLFVILWGCRSMSGSTTEVEHMVGGDTLTIICRGGDPVEEVGGYQKSEVSEGQARQVRARCQDEHSDQRGGARALLILGVIAVAYGAFEYRQAAKK